MKFKYIAFLLLAAATACTGGNPNAPTFNGPGALATRAGVASLSAQATNPIEWGADRKLKWEDFKGTPDPSSPKDAVSAVFVTHTWNCDYYGNFTFTVTAIFEPDNSWVKPSAKSDALLGHEQGHFDLAEVYARKLRKALADLKDPCKDLQRTGQTIDKLAADNEGDLLKEQKKYDDQTNDGTDAKKQGQWADRIKRDLGR